MTATIRARNLVLARHARAENDAPSDAARELSDAGHADAAAMGRWLNESGHSFDAVVSSTATRTRQTWRDIETAGVRAKDVRFDPRIYTADAGALLEILVEIPDHVRSVLVIGHAPTIPELADLLAEPRTSERAALDTLRSSFPAGSLAVLTLTSPWTGLTVGGAALQELVTPRG
ncbi:MAG: histidine phosphatase family protein [Geodermatophilaceae bacterium]|nr:histidine phosphatase family protein [Geodermatophilaceae bacterium]